MYLYINNFKTIYLTLAIRYNHLFHIYRLNPIENL